MGKAFIQWKYESKRYEWLSHGRRCTGEVSKFVTGAVESESPSGFSFMLHFLGYKARHVELDLSNNKKILDTQNRFVCCVVFGRRLEWTLGATAILVFQ
jgi:hypothetical protein